MFLMSFQHVLKHLIMNNFTVFKYISKITTIGISFMLRSKVVCNIPYPREKKYPKMEYFFFKVKVVYFISWFLVCDCSLFRILEIAIVLY
jgi:hypothetical protein